MSEYVTLMGAEEVSKAGYVMRDAAAKMQMAVFNLDVALEQQRRFMDDWLQRLENALKESAK